MPRGVLRDGAVLRADALRTGVLVALVTDHAVMNLGQDVAPVHARVGEREPVPETAVRLGAGQRLRKSGIGVIDLHEMEGIDRAGEAEDDPVAARRAGHQPRRPPLERLDVALDEGGVLCGGARLDKGLTIEQPAAGQGGGPLGIVPVPFGGDQPRHPFPVLGAARDRAPFQHRQHAAPDEVHLEAEERVLSPSVLADRGQLGFDAKQPRHERAHVRRHLDQERGRLGGGSRRVRRPAVIIPPRPERRRRLPHLVVEAIVERPQAFGLIEIGVGEAVDAEPEPRGCEGNSIHSGSVSSVRWTLEGSQLDRAER